MGGAGDTRWNLQFCSHHNTPLKLITSLDIFIGEELEPNQKVVLKMTKNFCQNETAETQLRIWMRSAWHSQ